MVLFGWTVLSVAQGPKKTTAPPSGEKTTEKEDELAAEEAKEKAIAEKFKKILETNPRRGTALDRLYGYHVERGTLDQLIGEYAGRTKKDPKDGSAWMIIGLLESQRGKDAAAVAAFRQAETNLPDNAIPGYYLGQSLVLVGQPDAAAEAYERAISRKPNRNDLLDIFQALGRVYQRAQQTDKALDVWNRLEKLFPDDARVQEQIVTTLIEESQFEQALPRLEKLAAKTDDKYRQSMFRIDIAETKVKLKKTTDALTDFEKLIAELDPDSWLHRDVRRRIEDVFLRADDLAGLAKYYEKWLEKNPTDVDAFARLAKNLASQGRAPEARAWLEKGLVAAPSNRTLRQGLIDQLVFEQNFGAAAQQYEALDKADPNNPDTLREWGKMLLRDPAKPEAERKTAAATVWKKLLEKKPNDPVTTSQVADLMRTAGATDEAIALYKKAITLAPDAAQYREYLGEYYHSLMRSADALATWRPIAEGANRSAKNLARLAEVFAGFGYRKEAIAALADAITLDKDDFTLLMTYADQLYQDAQHDLALTQIAAASKRTSNPEEVEQVLVAEIKVYQAMEKLADQIDVLGKELAAGKDATAERWLRLARFFEANRQLDKASEAIAKAGEKDAKSIPVLIAAARIYESGGNMLAAADTNRKLAALDRRFRTEYLTAVAKLEQRLGRREQALQAGRDLLAASPGNPEVYKFFSELCFQLGDQEEGLEALRRSVRANPSDPQGLITLANALGERLRQGEAIELLWHAFEKSNELESKLGVIDRITQLYLENNQFDRLVERLERERREAEKVREMTMCLAQAYTTAGDLGTARAQLERLLTENNRDTSLLGQLVALCESEGDLTSALKFQRQLNAAAPNNYDHQLKMAQILTRAGEADEAADIWVKLVAGETDPHRNLSAIDQLLTAGKYDAALAILARMVAQKPGNWELIYREGATLVAKGRADEAAVRFKALLALKTADDELSEITKHQIEQAKKNAAKANQPRPVYNPYNSRYDELTNPPILRRTGNLQRIRSAVGLDNRDYYYGGGQQAFYVPADYGEARMASLGFLLDQARSKGNSDAFAKQLRDAKDKAGADPRPLWDWFYLQTLRGEKKDLLQTAFTLSKGTDPAGLLAYLTTVRSRTEQPNVRRRRGMDNAKDTTPPLPADQLAHVIACFQKLKQTKPTWINGNVTDIILTELKRAKKADEELGVYTDLVKDANTVEKVEAAMNIAAGRNDLTVTLLLFNKLEKLQSPAKTTAALAQLPTRQTWYTLLTLMGKRADEKQYADTLRVLDHYLSTIRKQNLAVAGAASATRRQPTGGTQLQFYSKIQSYGPPDRNLAFPSPNDYYDEGAINLLYNVYLFYKKADLSSDLLAHFRNQLPEAKGPDRLYLQLAIGYLHWWAEEKDEAVAMLTEAVQSAPGDHNLLLEVAELREQNGEPDAALALLDSIMPLDTQMMQRREEMALRLAERTGNVERARQAAERMFGLRLDPEKQLDLAGKMHRLGMAPLAETVLNRAQRQAGNKTATLLRLMTQYQSQNQGDLAVQIARQILRKGPNTNFNNIYRGYYDEGDDARDQAIGVLARSGQLKEMIERAEAQLKASPKSIQIHQALLGYYQAAGEKEKLKAALLKMAELKPDDGKLRFQVAQQLQQAGERDAALAQYKIAIKLEPVVFSNRYWDIQNLFAQANKYEELAQLFDEVDLRKIGNYWSVFEMVSVLLQNDKGKDLGLKLFKKAWEAFPANRGRLLSRLYDESVWHLPEIYSFAKEAVIPREDSDIDSWQSANEIMSYGNDGRIDGVVTRLLSIARKQQRLPELRAEVQAVSAKHPDWLAGKVLLAIIEIQSGNKEAGKKIWQEVFDDPKLDIPPLARFILCQELEFYAGVEDMALKTLEGGIDDMLKDGSFEYSSSPARRLIWWYEQLGRKEDAKKLQLRFLTTEQSDPGYGGGYWQYRIVQNRLSIADELQRLGETVEAVRIYNRLLADQTMLDQASQYYGGGDRFDQMVEQGLQNALRSLKPGKLPQAVGALLTTHEITATNTSALDLVILLESRELSKAKLNSVFAAAIKSTEKAPEVRRDAIAKLSELVKKYPSDFSVQTAAALAAFANAKPENIQAALARLVKLVEATPLEALPANGKPNARHRAEALPQVALWLVARECLSKDKERAAYHEAGEKLAARAVAAARRQQELVFAMAILREWGQLDLDRGEKAKAETHWTELLELSLPKQQPKNADAATNPGVPAPVPAAPVPAPVPKSPLSRTPADVDDGTACTVAVSAQAPPAAVPSVPAGKAPARGNAPVLSAEQFTQTYAVAVLAAEKELPALSLKAMRDAVRGGPPVPGKPNRNYGGRIMPRMIGGVQYYVEDTGDAQISVEQALLELVPRWRALKVPPADIYEVVAGAVLPDARPAEVFLHSEGRIYGTIYTLHPGGYLTPASGVADDGVEDRGLCDLLCDVAIDAGKVDALRDRAKTRLGQPLGEIPSQVLLATLAMRAKDEPRAIEMLKTLGARIQKDSLQGTNDRVTAVLLPALANPKYADLVIPFIEKAADNYIAGNNAQRAVDLRFKLAQHYLKQKNETAARAQFKIVEGFGKKFGRDYDVHTPLASEYLKAGWIDEALRELALHADEISASGANPRVRPNRQEPTLGEFPKLVRLLLDLPAARRYEVLKTWSLPTEGRKSIRYYIGILPRDIPPAPFSKLPAMPEGQIVTTMLLLADAAKEAGKAEELAGVATKLAADKIENADMFLVLVKLSQGKGKEVEPALKAFSETAHKRLTEKREQNLNPPPYYDDYEDRQPTPVHPSELLFTSMCLSDPALVAHGEALLQPMLDRAQATHNPEYIHRIVSIWKRLGATRAGAPDALLAGVPARWYPITPRANWFAQDNYLVQGWNDQPSFLLFDTPLTGTFEFSVDVYQGHYTEGHAGYAGVVYEPNRENVASSVWATGMYDQVFKQAPGIRNEDFNRLTFQVSPGKVRCLLNDQIFYEDTDPQPTSPWIMLYAATGRRPVFRNFTLTGKPEVPAEVKLSGGNSLGGWIPYLHGGQLPARMLKKEQATGQAFDQWGNPIQTNTQKEPKYDWQAKDGEILGLKVDRTRISPLPSTLAYHRPLRPGETLKYEFFYEPGKTHVYPSLGRLVFMLEPDGVKLHWMTTGEDWTGVAADNALLDAAGNKTDKLPLKAGEWNSLTLSTTADGAKLELNGTVVYEGKLPAGNERLFGLFHHEDKTAVRVRNVTLTGQWPKALPALEEVNFATKPANAAEAKARRWQLGEKYYDSEAGDIVERAKKLPPAEQYKFLADWVLPSESRPTFQLAGVNQPLDVLGVVDQKEQPEGRRVMLGYRFDAPCLELVAAAKAAGKLDELAERIAKADTPAADELFRRSKTAYLAVVRGAQGRDGDATELLKQLLASFKKLTPDTNANERWPDLIAVTGTLERPVLLKTSGELVEAMNQNVNNSIVQNKPFDNRDWWFRSYRALRARVQVQLQPEGVRRPFGSDTNFAHWVSVPGVNANNRSQAWSIPHWYYKDGLVAHLPGHNDDYLILRTPLRGDFELTCDLRVQGWAEAHVRYGACQFDLNHDWKKYKLHTTITQNGRDVNIAPPIDHKGNDYKFKLVVKDGWYRAYVNGRELAAEKIGDNPDPWLMFHAAGNNTGELRNVMINGTPIVPEKIDLLANDSLGMWRPYLGNISNNINAGSGWSKRGEEMHEPGQKLEPPDDGKPLPRHFPESAVYYQRPFLEDGVVEYEFFYNPDKACVHPMLDRLVFMLEPDGVKLHWLTDGPREKSGVSFDNIKDEPNCRRGPEKLPLKEKAWNTVQMVVTGDTVKVMLNGAQVYERAIESTNQRFFGLFHYTDRTEARVRSMTYKGDWPKTLPANDKLFEKK
jgi:tetratricopeptide (TPR) repeat protein